MASTVPVMTSVISALVNPHVVPRENNHISWSRAVLPYEYRCLRKLNARIALSCSALCVPSA
jgi:hypothetical protein